MAAIGAIRKHGVALLIIIGIALLAFLLGDLSHVTRAFSSKYIMAKIDGEKLDKVYSEQYDQNTSLMKFMQNKSSFDEGETYQIHEMTWRQMLQDKVLDKQLKSLGLVYTDQMVEDFKADMLASLKTQQPNQYLAQFAQALANIYGAENAISILTNIEEYKNQEQAKEIYGAYQAIVRFALSAEKSAHYFALVQNTVYFSDPMAKQLAKDNKSAMVSLLTINPQAPAFKNITATVTPQELKAFYKLHKKELFTTHERNRDIDVAIFPINPTNGDMKTIEDSVRADYQRFTVSTSLAEYATEKGNGVVDSTYYKKEDIQLEGMDSLIFKQPVGSFIAPFNYQNMKWYFGKVYGGAVRPDSVQVASIELPFKTQQNPNAKRTKAQAQALADSLKGLLLGNKASVFALQKNYLDGRKQGDTTMWIPEKGTIASLYNDLIGTTNGGVYIYTAPNGYIVFQVLNRTAPIEKRQFVMYDYDIVASEATKSKIKSQALQFAGSISSALELETAAARRGIQVIKGTNVTSMTASIGQLNNCRDIISWAYSDKMKKNDVSDVMNINNLYFAVASIKAVHNVGTMKFKDVKSQIETQLAAEKKAEMVAKQINGSLSSSTMAAISQQYTSPIMDSVILSFTGDSYQNRNIDNYAIGKIFSLTPNKPAAVNGKTMVYVVDVKQYHQAAATPNLAMEKNILRNEVLGRDRNEMTLLTYFINNTKVIDNRSNIYQK